jgi:hypothetical protein
MPCHYFDSIVTLSGKFDPADKRSFPAASRRSSDFPTQKKGMKICHFFGTGLARIYECPHAK